MQRGAELEAGVPARGHRRRRDRGRVPRARPAEDYRVTYRKRGIGPPHAHRKRLRFVWRAECTRVVSVRKRSLVQRVAAVRAALADSRYVAVAPAHHPWIMGRASRRHGPGPLNGTSSALVFCHLASPACCKIMRAPCPSRRRSRRRDGGHGQSVCEPSSPATPDHAQTANVLPTQ
ncbi:hypothetical protein PAHAL_9G571500 [Panicum hallii]|jgi:hypothetical protein|uniref:Uncharacterized protein n=1 Tax=Panicum hallii TaxID=206008 RepID=A0A2T8I628_9POAL|nr:hypothetical protein PAHAL_9G571500 [Panicum hallii]